MSRFVLALALLFGFLLGGCAREAPRARSPEPGFAPWITARPTRPSTAKASRDRTPGPRAFALSKDHVVTTTARGPLPSDRLPGGVRCLAQLKDAGVAFDEPRAFRGVDTPVQLRGPIGAIEFWSPAGRLVADCRFVLALVEVAPEFAALGVRRVRFSGAYVYRTSRTGRLSLHAYGLALDLHEVMTDDASYTVEHDYARGVGEACLRDAPLMNHLACRLRRRDLFRELLTPDYNADHYDHLHLGIAPLPTSDALARGQREQPPRSRRASAGRRQGPTKVAAKDGRRKSSSEVKTARKSGQGSPVRVQPSAPDPGVARLRADLEELAKVAGQGLDAPASNDAGELLPVEPQSSELLGTGAPQ